MALQENDFYAMAAAGGLVGREREAVPSGGADIGYRLRVAAVAIADIRVGQDLAVPAAANLVASDPILQTQTQSNGSRWVCAQVVGEIEVEVRARLLHGWVERNG